MAEIVDHEWRATGRSLYPWDEWLDGQARKLTRGEDFDVIPSAMVRTAHHAAKVRSMRVRTSLVGNDALIIQAFSKEQA